MKNGLAKDANTELGRGVAISFEVESHNTMRMLVYHWPVCARVTFEIKALLPNPTLVSNPIQSNPVCCCFALP